MQQGHARLFALRLAWGCNHWGGIAACLVRFARAAGATRRAFRARFAFGRVDQGAGLLPIAIGGNRQTIRLTGHELVACILRSLGLVLVRIPTAIMAILAAIMALLLFAARVHLALRLA